jgi:preprotein translocase subunit SecD
LKSAYWFILPILVLIVSLTILYPNFATRELELVINPDIKNLPVEERTKILQKFQENWTSEYSRGNSMKIEPPLTTTEVPDGGKFTVSGRFITTALINQISQENSDLFLESKNKIKPLSIENYLRDGKSLSIKFGLDLQGGMRVVLKGDFEHYLTKLKDIYANEISELNTTIASPEKTAAEKEKAQKRLDEIMEGFELSPDRKYIELEKAKLIIDNRLTNQNLTEPQVRIQKEQEAIEVSLPGVANSTQILDILQSTETVEYRLEEPSSPGSFGNQIYQEEQKLLEQGKREETDIVQYQKLIQNRMGKKAEEEFFNRLEEKYKIPKDKYKIFAYWSRGQKANSAFLPRRFTVLERAIALSGNDMTEARPYYNTNTYTYSVSFSLTPAGSKKFFDLTSNNRGRNLSIVWGNKVVSNPVINDPIAGGHAEITGSFSKEESTQLSNVISEGALPIELSVLEIRFIGPTLGLESIVVGIKSVAIGFALVMVFMIMYYGMTGIIADISLLLNLVILSAMLSLMDFTLTLPGFAGVILTVGMAVDANVIIYERIKEELANGKSITNAVTFGFQNAFWTIFDSNLTTLIAGILMVRLGNGPIKGFAITLCWGIVSSMFTSLVVSRILLEFTVNTLGVKSLRIGFRKPEVKHV